MSMTIEQRATIIKYLKTHKISYQLTSPKTFTSSVNYPNALVIKIEDKNKLENLMAEINQLNTTRGNHPRIYASVIGGGRGGNNNSYSIGKLWEGVDVFLQLAWKPEFAIREADEIKTEDNEAICRISANMMLVELNQHLYEKGYYSPTLCGSLQFMSFAGGLATGSHTAYGYLSEMVEGLQVLLPNGEMKYFAKNDKDFSLYTTSASLGMLGIITAVDIKVNKGKKKLKRIVELSTYDTFMKKIREQVEQGISLDSRAIIFSSVNLKKDSPVKLTRWEWVSAETPNAGVVESQVADNSLIGRSILPMFAKKYPKMLSSIFRKVALTSGLEGVSVAPPASLMGAEAKVVGQLTEMGIFFAYNEKLDAILNHIFELAEEHRIQNTFPVNTAIYIRFPKKPDSNEHMVVIDFASMGLNLQPTKDFVDEVIAYLNKQDIKANIHYGKSYGVNLNKSLTSADGGWEALKKRCEVFYADHGMDEGMLKLRMDALENMGSTPRLKLN